MYFLAPLALRPNVLSEPACEVPMVELELLKDEAMLYGEDLMLDSSRLGLLVMDGLVRDDNRWRRPPAVELELCPEAVKYRGLSGLTYASFSSSAGTPNVGSRVSAAWSKARCCERTCEGFREWLIDSIYASGIGRSTSSGIKLGQVRDREAKCGERYES